MTAGTKVSVAIVVLFAAVLGIYYGIGGPDGAGPAELLPPAEDPIVEVVQVDEAPAAENDSTGSDLARTIEEALWSQGGAMIDSRAAAGVFGSDILSAVNRPDDPWVLRAPTLLPEPETDAISAATPRSSRTVQYVVQPEDSMWTIAQRWFGDGLQWRRIADGNPDVDPERLQVGQLLRLPVLPDNRSVGLNRAASIPAARSMTPGPSGSGRYYTVRAGDTLSAIAVDERVGWREIYDANRVAIGGSPDRLQVGMKLRIP